MSCKFKIGITLCAVSILVARLIMPAMAAPAVSLENNLAFSLDLYGKVRDGEGNIVFSPYSIQEALSLAAVGAKGETAVQMQSTLRTQTATGEVPSRELAEKIEAIRAKGEVIINVANALWLSKEYQFLDTFLKIAKDSFHSELNYADFINAAESARLEINKWVAEKTHDKIKDLIGAGALTPATRLVIVNAIYLKALWETEFEKNSTRDKDFWVTATTSAVVPTMNRTAHFEYAESDAMQLLSLPYKGRDISMLIFLPKNRAGLPAFEKRVTPKLVTELVGNLTSKEVMVALPKFKARLNLSLVKILGALGMVDAFNPDKADFSGMDGTRKLYVSEVVHQAFIETDEKGTEAAAATALIMRAGSVRLDKPIEFIADHPFIFAIRENSSGNVLFIGRVVDPR